MLMSGCASSAPLTKPMESVTVKTKQLDSSRTRVTINWQHHDLPKVLAVYFPYQTDEAYDSMNRIVSVFGERMGHLDGVVIARTIATSTGTDSFVINRKLLANYTGREEAEILTLFLNSLTIQIVKNSGVKRSVSISTDHINLQNEFPSMTLLNQRASDCFEGIPEVRKQQLEENSAVEVYGIQKLAFESQGILKDN